MYSVVKLFDRNNKKSIKFYKLKFDKLKKKGIANWQRKVKFFRMLLNDTVKSYTPSASHQRSLKLQ